MVAIHLTDNFDASVQDKAMEHDIDLLNDEMVAAGVRVSASSKLAASSKAAVACRAPIELRRFTDGRPIERLFTAPAAGEHQPVLEETA